MGSFTLVFVYSKGVDCGTYCPQISVHNKYHNSIFSFSLDGEVRVWMTIVWPCSYLKGVGFWQYGFTDFHVIFRKLLGCAADQRMSSV